MDLLTLIEQLEPELQRAFLAAMDDLRYGIDVRALVASLERNDIDGAVAALGITHGALEKYKLVRQSQYVEAGQRLVVSIMSLPNAPRYRFEYDDYWTEEVDGAIDYMIEESEGFFFGWFQAMLVAGFSARAILRRAVPLIGLSAPQAQYVDSMRARLASRDPEELAKIIGRYKDGKWVAGTGMTQRNRRYDRIIMAAIKKGGKGITAKQADEMAQAYAKNLAKRRAIDIAKTQAAQAVAAAQFAAVGQALDKAGAGSYVKKTWLHLGPLKHAREYHVAMNNKSVIGLNTPFIMPDGVIMQHDHDPAGGIKHNANCRCGTRYEIKFRKV